MIFEVKGKVDHAAQESIDGCSVGVCVSSISATRPIPVPDDAYL